MTSHKYKIGDKICVKSPGFNNYLYNVVGTIVDTLPGRNNLSGYEVKFPLNTTNKYSTNNYYIIMAETDIALIE